MPKRKTCLERRFFLIKKTVDNSPLVSIGMLLYNSIRKRKHLFSKKTKTKNTIQMKKSISRIINFSRSK
jgi:hypothetical protein